MQIWVAVLFLEIIGLILSLFNKETFLVEYKTLGKTDLKISTVGLGTWAIGGSWGAINDDEAMQTLNHALDLGINFFDTADVYGDGRSEKLLGQLRKERRDPFYIATKVGLKIDPHDLENFTRENLVTFVDNSLKNLGVEALDLLQLHSPPTDVYYRPEVFAIFEDLVTMGKVKNCGVSVNRVEEGLKVLDYPIIQSVQLVFNIFRQRPAEIFFAEAKKRDVGVLARLPLSSGMLTGKMTQNTVFEKTDHRYYNRNGEAFDHGDTFSGLDYNIALKAVKELVPLIGDNQPMAQWALRWVLMHDAVTCVIPGARQPSQVEENIQSAELAPLDPSTMAAVQNIYKKYIKPQIHARW